MSHPLLREEALSWRRELVKFVLARRRSRPGREDLSPLQDWQRRITGGVLIQFFDLLSKTATEELYPQLLEHPLQERVFLFITDEAGYLAADELMDLKSLQALCVLKEHWRAFLEHPDTNDDDEFIHHYQFWSVWHQDIPENWDVPPLEPGFEYWIHEEGFALADGAGRGAQHIWRWDGQTLELTEELMSSWTS